MTTQHPRPLLAPGELAPQDAPMWLGLHRGAAIRGAFASSSGRKPRDTSQRYDEFGEPIEDAPRHLVPDAPSEIVASFSMHGAPLPAPVPEPVQATPPRRATLTLKAAPASLPPVPEPGRRITYAEPAPRPRTLRPLRSDDEIPGLGPQPDIDTRHAFRLPNGEQGTPVPGATPLDLRDDYIDRWAAFAALPFGLGARVRADAMANICTAPTTFRPRF